MEEKFYEFLRAKIEIRELDDNDDQIAPDIVLENKLMNYNTGMSDLGDEIENLKTKISITKSTFMRLREDLGSQFHLGEGARPLEYRYFPKFEMAKKMNSSIIEKSKGLKDHEKK